jgi:hypothetical protein
MCVTTLSGQEGLYEAIWLKLRNVNCDCLWAGAPAGVESRNERCGDGIVAGGYLLDAVSS